MTLKQKYEAKCQESARWKRDAVAMQTEVSQLRRELDVARNDRDEAVALLRDSKAAIANLERELARVKSMPPKVQRVEVPVDRVVEKPVEKIVTKTVEKPVERVVTKTIIAPPATFARDINGPYTAKIGALEVALGVLGERLRAAGLDDSVKGYKWGSD